MDSSDSGYCIVEGYCEHVNERSGSIQSGELVDELNMRTVSQEGMYLVG